MSITTDNGKIAVAAEALWSDPMLIMEALALSSKEGLELAEETQTAVFQYKEGLKACHAQTVYENICAVITGKNALSVLLKYPDVLACAMPEMEKSIGFDQRNEHHCYDVWEHTVRALDYIAPDKISRLVMLLHDLGKPHTFSLDGKGVGHFYGHAKESARLAREFFARSGEEKTVAETVIRLVEIHDSDLFATEKSIKRWLRKMTLPQLIQLIDIKKADCSAQAPEFSDRLDLLEATREKVIKIAYLQSFLD